MPTRNANSVAAARLPVPASIATKIVAAERDVPGKIPATTCARPTRIATRQVISLLFRLTRGKRFRADHPDAADDQRPRDRRQRFGQLESELRRGKAEHRGDRERDRELHRVVAIARVAKTGRELPQPLAVDQHDGEDRAGLDHDVENLRAMAEPVFGDQQMAGARDRQEFGDAFDDPEQDRD